MCQLNNQSRSWKASETHRLNKLWKTWWYIFNIQSEEVRQGLVTKQALESTERSKAELLNGMCIYYERNKSRSNCSSYSRNNFLAEMHSVMAKSLYGMFLCGSKVVVFIN